jgi:hypothetical protein
MWIIPKTLSAFVQDTEGLNLDLDERAWMLGQSAMWRSKPSSKQTWLRRLKKGGWITPLSTRILKPSQQKYFEEKYTASLEDIPVSRSVARESEKERKTQDTYGHTSESMSGQLDLFGAFSKMSEATPRWGYGESCPIWKRMVTERSGDCSARRKQARLTNASECSSWPTARTSDSQGHSESKIKRVIEGTMPAGKAQLREWVNPNWPTPRAGNPGSRKPGTGGKILAEEAKKNWATPVVGDSVNAKQGDCTNRKRNPGQTLCDQISGPPAQEKSSTSGKNHGSPKLNPNWVEQLMGLPIGWTDLGSWATESSHKQQN